MVGFEDGELDHSMNLETLHARKPNLGQRKVNVDFPSLDDRIAQPDSTQDGRRHVSRLSRYGWRRGSKQEPGCDQGLMPQLHRETALESEMGLKFFRAFRRIHPLRAHDRANSPAGRRNSV